MAYQVLARKWRPQTFDEIRGQAHIARALRNAITSKRIAHAYLFTGIRGVGKTSAARVLAKALNCSGGPTPTPCNRCDSCREITDGKSTDVLEIDGASNTGVEDVRKLREAVRYPPVRGPYRVYIIDEVHMLSTAAFNALLKTLEEPPEHVVFIFATTDAHKIPVTILSRCQQFDFKRLSPRELIELLRDVAAAEGVSIEDKGLVALAREADGSVRDGQSLLDQVISYAGGTVRYEDVRDVLGVVDRDVVFAVIAAVLTGDARGVLEQLAEAERFGFDARRFAMDLLDLLRDLCVLGAVGDGDDLVDLAPEEVDEARRLLEGVSWEDVQARFDMLARAVETLRSAARPAVVLEMALLKLARMPALLPLSELLDRVERVPDPPGGERGRGGSRPRGAPAQGGTPASSERSASAAPGRSEPTPVGESTPRPGKPAPETEPAARPTRAPSTPVAAAAPATDPGPEPEPKVAPAPPPVWERDELWRQLLAGAEKANRPFWSVLTSHAELRQWDAAAKAAVVGYDDPSHEFFLKAKTDLLERLLRDLVGPGASLQLVCEGKCAAAKDPQRETDRDRNVKREAFDHPLVRDAVELFDGDIEEIRLLRQ